eukprot:TRINITY_DN94955_c0_g1_i1.p1 TRINITY_DN94955_c0_g1~~TRINITY_DN94955_c0_g1_i1.p1  ORF type:complete len:391 (+),score=80.81 TRINITY_DN94955_c0_g1_i1:83-1255(+)
MKFLILFGTGLHLCGAVRSRSAEETKTTSLQGLVSDDPEVGTEEGGHTSEDFDPDTEPLRDVTTNAKDRGCARKYSYPSEADYIAKMKQGKPSDPFLVQIASVANRIYNFASPVAGWTLRLKHEYSNENCKWNQNIGIYTRKLGGKRRCALAISGTDQWVADSWYTNFNMSVGDFCGFKGVHDGYTERLGHFLNDEAGSFGKGPVFAEFLAYLNDKRRCDEVILVGHSMGGAMATMMAACASRRKWFNVDSLYTFASPGVSTEERLYNEASENGCFKGLRVYSKDSMSGDIIPMLSSPGGYLHPKVHEFRLKKGWGDKYSVKKRDCQSKHSATQPHMMGRFGWIGSHMCTEYVRRLLKTYGIDRPKGKEIPQKIVYSLDEVKDDSNETGA